MEHERPATAKVCGQLAESGGDRLALSCWAEEVGPVSADDQVAPSTDIGFAPGSGLSRRLRAPRVL